MFEEIVFSGKINKCIYLIKEYGPYGPQGPWAQPLFEPVAELFVFFGILGVPTIKNEIFHGNCGIFGDFYYFGQC